MHNRIRNMIENCIGHGGKIIIYPFGNIGIQVKNILNIAYGVQEAYIVDDKLCKYNSNIKGTELFDKINTSEYVVLLSLTNPSIYYELEEKLSKYFIAENIFSLGLRWWEKEIYHTKIGKYSSGPICRNHPFIESIGAFCSFAEGVCVHGNHAMEYITTHPMLYKGSPNSPLESHLPYDEYNEAPWYIGGVQPIGEIKNAKRITIGNDVWLGRNVIVVNYSSIGNGVIAGAGAVITHDVPDYAVVVGAPARIIRYRYKAEQIAALNKIEWWKWSDEMIRERFADFYLPIENFIEKYL